MNADGSPQPSRDGHHDVGVMPMIQLPIDQPKNDQGNKCASQKSHTETSATVPKVPAKTGPPMKNPAQAGWLAHPVHVERVSQENAYAEEKARRCDDLGHSFPPCLAMPGRAWW
jgi:hypothetical protein